MKLLLHAIAHAAVNALCQSQYGLQVMSDHLPKADRSALMSRIRSSGNKSTELRLARILRAASISGWRRNQKVHGKPDFIFPGSYVAVFVDGCFWHGCSQCKRLPRINQMYWGSKIRRNRLRDSSVSRRLRREGWRVLRVWEHELATPSLVVKRIERALEGATDIK